MLVARRGELATVRDRLGRGAPTLVLGEAGIGKTALLRAAATASGARLYEGGGLASLSFSSFLPLARAMGRSPEGDPAAVAAWAEGRIGDGGLLIDDLQWCDPDTLAVIPLLARKVKLLSAVRLGDPASWSALALAERAGFGVVRLEPLRDTGARELVHRCQPDLDE